MAWFGGRVQRQSTKAAIVFGVIALVAFIAPSILAAVGSKHEALAGLSIILSMGILVCALVGAVVSLIVRVARKSVAVPSSPEMVRASAQDLVTAPALPNSPLEDPRQPAGVPGFPEEAQDETTGAVMRPRTVLVAIAIAVALVAWQVSVGVRGLDMGRLMAKNPSLFPPEMPMGAVKWIFGVIFGFVLALAIPLACGVIQAYRGFGRVLTFSAWLYVVLTIPSVIFDVTGQDHTALFVDILALLAGVAVIVLQRQSASKTYYANRRRQKTLKSRPSPVS